jgi:hypothetical protein
MLKFIPMRIMASLRNIRTYLTMLIADKDAREAVE